MELAHKAAFAMLGPSDTIKPGALNRSECHGVYLPIQFYARSPSAEYLLAEEKVGRPKCSAINHHPSPFNQEFPLIRHDRPICSHPKGVFVQNIFIWKSASLICLTTFCQNPSQISVQWLSPTASSPNPHGASSALVSRPPSSPLVLWP